MNIKLLSISTKGLINPAKRVLLWKLATQNQCDVLCVQETHFQASCPPTCTNKNFTTIFTASASVKKKGVVIAMNNSLPFQLQKCITNQEGRYIILTCTIKNTLYTIVSVYAPNVHQL